MSYIEAINQAATTSSQSVTKSGVESDAALGKQDFLTLLVAQLQNQDPLNPDDPTEFTAQLAQFSSLEQLFTLNETMESVADSIAKSDRMGALETIGKDVAYESNSFEYNGKDIEIGYSLDGNATDVTMYLQYNGSTIKVIEAEDLTAGNHFVTFDGTTESGTIAPFGTYNIVLQASAAEGTTVEATTLVKSEVTGIDLDGTNGGTLHTYAGDIGYNLIIGVYDKSSGSSSDVVADEEPEENTDESLAEEIIADAAEDAVDAAIEETI